MTSMNSAVQTKLEELCKSILSQPEVEAHRLRVDQFLIDDEARSQYVRLTEQGEHLHHKQAQGVELTEQEIAEFERGREALLNNPVARGFLDAQEALEELRERINRFVGKTLELGRLPNPEEVSGGCGHGCGCGHGH